MRTHFLAPLLKAPKAKWSLVAERTDVVIASEVRTAFDSASRREGLLKQAEWPAGSALIIAPCQAVHTFGMTFAIDVLFVDREGRVVKTRERVLPWRMAGAMWAFAVVELPEGTLATRPVLNGDLLRVRSKVSPPLDAAP